MKKLYVFPLVCGVVCAPSNFAAQANDKKPAKPALSNQKLSKSAAILKDPAIVISTTAPNVERVGEVYRLWLSINPTDDNDDFYLMQPPKALLDAVFSNGPRRSGNAPGFECYGFLKINEAIRWRIAPDAASRHIVSVMPELLPPRNVNPPQNGPDPLKFNPRKQGYSINRNLHALNGPAATPERIFEVTYNKHLPATKQMRLEMKLTDRDALPPAWAPLKAYVDTRDDVFGDFKATIDLTKLGASDGHYYWFWKGTDDHGKTVGSQLYLHVEHVRGIYQNSSADKGLRKPKIEPKIADKKFPGGVRGPGPIANTKIKKSAPGK